MVRGILKIVAKNKSAELDIYCCYGSHSLWQGFNPLILESQKSLTIWMKYGRQKQSCENIFTRNVMLTVLTNISPSNILQIYKLKSLLIQVRPKKRNSLFPVTVR